MMMFKRTILWNIPLALILIFASWMRFAEATEIEWKKKGFSVTYLDADIKDVLSDMIARNGQNPIFLPGVEGLVSFDFRDTSMPLKAAFNKLMAEHNLSYFYNPDDNSVKISPASSTMIVNAIFAPSYSTLEQIKDALSRFGLEGGNVFLKVDHATGAIFLRGTQSEVTELKRIAAQIDNAVNKTNQRLYRERTRQLEEKRAILELQRSEVALAQEKKLLKSCKK